MSDGTCARVERVVGERAMEAHEELAEIFLTVAAIVAAVAAAPLTAGIVGRAARALIAVDLASVQRAGSDPEAWRATVIDL